MSETAEPTAPRVLRSLFHHSFMPHLAAVPGIALVTLLYAWQLVTHLATAIPGTTQDADVATMVWNVYWVQQALATPAGLLHTTRVLIPFGADLRLHTYGLWQGVLAYPLIGWLGVVGAFNTILLVTLFWNGVAAYAFVLYHVRQFAAAWIAAVWFMLGAPLLVFIRTGRPSLASLWIVCLALLVLAMLFNKPRAWKGLLLGFVLLAALLTDFQILLFTLLWMFFYGLDRFLRNPPILLNRPMLLYLGLAALVLAIPFFALYYSLLGNLRAQGYAQPSLEDTVVYSFRVWDYFDLAVIPYAYGWEFLASALLAVAWLRRGEYLFWLGGALLLLLLALGPFLQPTHVPLPFAAFHLWSPLAQFRTPGRFTALASVGLAVVAGFALARLFGRMRTSIVSVLLVVLLIAARLGWAWLHDPLAIQTYPEYAVYQKIASEPGDFAILEVPVGVRSGIAHFGRGEVLEYYQLVHGKRILNGMIARLPDKVFEFYQAHPALVLLSGQTPAPGSNVEQDWQQVLQWTNTRYVLVHRALLEPALADELESFLNRQPQIQRIGVERDLVIYQVKP